jgi:ABC-2 type transport system ATP-binding protein
MTEPAPPAVEIRELRVDYGDFVAVDDLTLSIPRGEIFGLVGPNGAGKTSTFRVLATLQEPTYGEVKMAGFDLFEQTSAVRAILGYMPDLAPVSSDLKVGELIDYYARCHGLNDPAARRTRVAECLEQVRLTDKRDAWCKALSRGQTQRLILAKTLLHRPEVLILDEPASGLDPLSRRELKLTLRTITAAGATILISSHILGELAEMCTSLGVMARGRLVASGGVEAVRRQLGSAERGLTLHFLARAEAAAAWLGTQEGVAQAQVQGELVHFQFTGPAAAQADLLAALMTAGFRFTTAEERRSSFEDILVEIASAA